MLETSSHEVYKQVDPQHKARPPFSSEIESSFMLTVILSPKTRTIDPTRPQFPLVIQIELHFVLYGI